MDSGVDEHLLMMKTIHYVKESSTLKFEICYDFHYSSIISLCAKFIVLGFNYYVDLVFKGGSLWRLCTFGRFDLIIHLW